MSEDITVQSSPSARSLADVLKEVEAAVAEQRAAHTLPESVKDLRWMFDQVSAKMNQAIYNDQHEHVHATTLQTVSILIEILARS